MIVLATALVVLPIVLGVCTYVLYPACLWVLAALRRPAGTAPVTDVPFITIVMAAYNEEHQIAAAIESLLAQDYPAERRQILIVSDASQDRTPDIVRSFADRGVELLQMPARVGKTAAENAAVAHIRGEIVVNTDASVRLHPHAVRELVLAMSDPGIGAASSRNVSMSNADSINGAEARYTGYEMWVRSLESRVGGIIGSSGAGYAIRASLHKHRVREDLSRDFSSALTARRHGLRAVAVDSALCFVPRAPTLRREYRRKVRTISRGMETLYFNRDLLDPLKYGSFAWKLITHKLCRWAVPISALGSVVGLVLLARTTMWAGAGLVGAVVVAVLAVVGATWPEDVHVPRFLPAAVLGALAANLAVVHSAWRFFRGHDDHIWEPTRRTSSPPRESAPASA